MWCAPRRLPDETVLVEKADITAELVGRLIEGQFPRWAHLPITTVEVDGWDNTTFRLGNDMSVRLPRGDGYVAQVEKEARWLPHLASHLPLPIPEPLAVGVASDDFPRPWSVRRWLPGVSATLDVVDDLGTLASELGEFLAALQRIDATDGPTAGEHSHYRGAALSHYDAQTRSVIGELAPTIDADNARRVWDTALASTWDRPPVWVHGDVAASNLLVVEGRLSSVIDFGCSAVGDPACDLAIAWTFFDDSSRHLFAERLALDGGTWARGRGWALWKALLTVREDTDKQWEESAAHRMGWRASALEILREVCGTSLP